jgi:hypothetical protein
MEEDNKIDLLNSREEFKDLECFINIPENTIWWHNILNSFKEYQEKTKWK